MPQVSLISRFLNLLLLIWPAITKKESFPLILISTQRRDFPSFFFFFFDFFVYICGWETLLFIGGKNIIRFKGFCPNLVFSVGNDDDSMDKAKDFFNSTMGELDYELKKHFVSDGIFKLR